MRRTGAVSLLALALWTTPAHTQVGESTDIITGVVVDIYGQPLPDVEIEAFSLDLEVSRTGTTDRSGRYMILFPDGGGQYRLTARLIGAMPQTVILVRHADEDRLIWDVQLREAGFVLDPVVKGITYDPFKILGEALPADDVRQLFESVQPGLKGISRAAYTEIAGGGMN